jgi:hypothetical protein
MNITIKNFKHLASLSEETLCFTATVCFNGKAVGSAENHGHGGSTFVHIKDDKVRDLLPISEWERTVDELTFAELRKKEDAKLSKSVKKQLERDIIFTRKGKEFEGRYFLFKKGNTTPELASSCRAKIALMRDVDLIVNDQPFEVAFKILVKDA